MGELAEVIPYAAQKAWRRNNPEQSNKINRRARIKRRFGITEEEYDARLVAASSCDCCGSPFVTKKNLDHCHETGHLRGVLCNKCNVGIGALGDSILGVKRALEYLRAKS